METNYSNWMSQNKGIHKKQLKHICLPAAHDTATWDLKNIMTKGAGQQYKTIMDTLKEIGDILAKTGIGREIDIPRWVEENAYETIKGLGQTIESNFNLTKELNLGVRAFDFRIYYEETKKEFYSVHTLLGSPYPPIIDELANFLASTQGEIIIVFAKRMFGYKSPVGMEGFTQLLKEKLGPYAYTRDQDSSNNPFEQTYNQIIHQNETPTSKVIILYEDSDDAIFWTEEKVNLQNPWSNKSFKEAAIEVQLAAFKKNLASKNPAPFGLSMTLTPQPDEVEKIMIAGIGPVIIKLQNLALKIPKVGKEIAAALGLVAEEFKKYDQSLRYRTLEELATTINTGLSQTIQTTFVPDSSQPNPIALIWTDFFNQTPVVDLAIELSNRPYQYP